MNTKKVLVTLFLFAYTIGSYAQTGTSLHWMTWQEAVTAVEKDKKAGEKSKIMIVDVYTQWCGWCKKMEKTTFENAKVSALLNNRFYPIRFDAESKDNITFQGYNFKFVPGQNGRGTHELAFSLLDGEMRYPTVVFLDANYQILQRVPGYLDEFTMYMILNYMTGAEYGKTAWSDYKEQFESDYDHTSLEKKSNTSKYRQTPQGINVRN